MANILEELAAYSRLRAAHDKEEVPARELISRIDRMAGEEGRRTPFCFEQALRKPGISFICEVKKASPSKGLIDPVFNYMDIAISYEEAGADCMSCLTEPRWFLGSDEIFKNIRKKVSTPMIRKDFTVDEYQIYQAKAMGADAVLLICSILGEKKISEYMDVCEDLGLTALVETHDEEEMRMAASCGARVIGVNNRNLKDFTVDTGNSMRLKELAPKDALFVSESGIKGPADIPPLKAQGIDAVLIGEALMRSPDKKAALEAFKNA